jgi:hypothetical protein
MGQDLYQDPLPAPDTFQAARQKVLNAIAAGELDTANATAGARKIGLMVGAYYSGIVEAGVPEQLAAILAGNYHDFLMEQVSLSSEAMRNVLHHGQD